MARYASGCRCGKRLEFGDGICMWCGRGSYVSPLPERVRRRRRLPWDLGALQREGRRPDTHLENVVRFERLTVRPTLRLVPELDDDEPVLRAAERRVLAHVASGLSNAQVAAVLGISVGTVGVHLSNIFGSLGLRTERGRASSDARAQAIEWWQGLHTGELAA